MRDEQKHRFASEVEANEFAQKNRRDFWAYDCLTNVWQDTKTGEWVVLVSTSRNCN